MKKQIRIMVKGVAVPYIIALILGIVVVTLIGYWFFITGGRIGSVGIETECKSKQVSYCQTWKALGYAVEPPAIDWGTCEKPTKDQCNKLIGGGRCTGSSTAICTDMSESSCKGALCCRWVANDCKAKPCAGMDKNLCGTCSGCSWEEG